MVKQSVILVSSGKQHHPMSPRRTVSVLYANALFAAGFSSVAMLGGQETVLASRFDGLLLSGGGDMDAGLFGQSPHPQTNPPDIQRDCEEIALIQAFCALRKPILGICRGIQVLNVIFGGDLIQQIPNHMDTSHPVRLTSDSILYQHYGEKMMVNSYHHQCIGKLAPGFRAIAHAPDGRIEAIVHKKLPILGVQWHAERMVKGVCMDEITDQTALFTWFDQDSRK